MSTLRFDELQDIDGAGGIKEATIFAGTPRAWVTVTTVSGTIDDDFNISSINDTGAAGNIDDVTFTNAMANANFAIATGPESNEVTRAVNTVYQNKTVNDFDIFNQISEIAGGTDTSFSAIITGDQVA